MFYCMVCYLSCLVLTLAFFFLLVPSVLIHNLISNKEEYEKVLLSDNIIHLFKAWMQKLAISLLLHFNLLLYIYVSNCSYICINYNCIVT